LIALIINAHPKIDEVDAEYCFLKINACFLVCVPPSNHSSKRSSSAERGSAPKNKH